MMGDSMSKTNPKARREVPESSVKADLLDGLNPRQQSAVASRSRQLLVMAGAGAGKTEVIARRIAWLIAEQGVPKDEIVAFTFTERAAEEMKFRIRRHGATLAAPGEEPTLGDMYVGTIHAFCINKLRELAPDEYHNFDIIDDVGRLALVQRTYSSYLGLSAFASELNALNPNAKFPVGQFRVIEKFLDAYDILNEYGEMDVRLSDATIPLDVTMDRDWCKEAKIVTKIGKSALSAAFAVSAARYYALLRCRRFLDFSTAQNEFLQLLRSNARLLMELRAKASTVVVDEVQDLNPVQRQILDLIVGDRGRLVAVGDHRQAIFGFRGSSVRIMGDMYESISKAPKSEVIDLTENYRSTPRIIALANAWASSIAPPGKLPNVDMKHGKVARKDYDASHVGITRFDTVEDEAAWIAQQIEKLVKGDKGARQDGNDRNRGIRYQDVAILLRASANARAFMKALESRGVPAVFRAGPDLFAQPEVLLFIAALSVASGITSFYGPIVEHISKSLACQPKTEDIADRAVAILAAQKLKISKDTATRLLLAARLVQRHIDKNGAPPTKVEVAALGYAPMKCWLLKSRKPRRVFPQDILHWFFAEAGVPALDDGSKRGESAMFHLGALSGIVQGIESSGWTSPSDFKYQMIAMTQWGSKKARTEEAPLLVKPSAVTIATIHAVKGLEFASVFVADVRAQSFPSSKATIIDSYPFEGTLAKRVDPRNHADNSNYDAERRLMYVALTRAERYLMISASGSNRSRFYKELELLVPSVGGTLSRPKLLQNIVLSKTEERSDIRLVTSFSDLRYYLECPHDFYLRKALGFSPTIDQAFGYGRGVHNLLRAVHVDPARWAKLSKDPKKLAAAVKTLVDNGLFYLRYTTGDPLENLQNRVVSVVADYIEIYREELSTLRFEPERPFETLLDEAHALVTGAIDLVRLDNPPRVSLIDFKSGRADSEMHQNSTRKKCNCRSRYTASRRKKKWSMSRISA